MLHVYGTAKNISHTQVVYANVTRVTRRENGCDWDSNTCSYAAENGHLHIIQWVRQNGCDWDSDTCLNAASKGHLACLQWARENGCDWDSDTCLD